ncbi:MAG: DsbA family protein [Polyangiales bacterium]
MVAGQKRVKGGLVAGYLGTLRARQKVIDLVTKLRPGQPRLEFYWRADDAYSHVMAQLVARLVEAYALDLEVVVVPAAAAEVDPEPQLRAAHAVRDAQALASFYDLSFSARSVTPRPDRVRRANAVALLPREPREHLSVLLRVGEALFGEGGAALSELTRTAGAVEGTLVTSTLEANYARLRERGHYQSATLRYGGEWYEGPHRVRNLEERLRLQQPDAPGAAAGSVLRERSPSWLPVAAPGTPLEVWFSFRSPYSYLAVMQLDALRQRGAAPNVVLRPVLPMVMRGLQVPTVKKLNLLRDAKREADRLDIPFGHIVDPVGAGAERCMAVFAAVAPSGRGLDFAVSATRGIWSESTDVASDAGLYAVAARAGIEAAEVDAALGDMARGLALADANRIALNEAGLWGVPSFRVGEFCTWGQDRLPLVLHTLGLPRPADS